MSQTLQDRIKPDTLVTINCGDATDPPRYVVGYWSIRGLGAPVRMMLSAAGASHWVAMYDTTESDGDGWNKDSWAADKKWMKQECDPFMNLPYLIDVREQVVICQTNAIQSYLGRELNMLGSTKMETVKCEEILCEIYDKRNHMVRFAYGLGSAPDALKAGKGHLSKLEDYLRSREGSPGKLVGETLTAPDFHLYEMLDQYQAMAAHYDLGDLFQLYPNLKEYKEAFEKLPENQLYLKSFLHKGLPFNNVMAKFGAVPKTNGQYQRGQATPWQKRGKMDL